MPHDPLELERRGWAALAVGGDTAVAFYDEVLADEVLVLLPGGLVIDDRATVVRSMSGAPWDAYELADERTLRLGDEVAVVTYRTDATRGDHRYEALIASTYVRTDAGWRLAVHQQTPIGS